MAKWAILAAVLGVLLVAATAKTTMLTVEVDEEENQRRRGGSCDDQLERAQMLSHCEDFLSEVSRGGPGAAQCGYGGSRFGPGGSRFGPGGGQFGPGSRGMRGSRHFDRCCSQLNQVDERCMCEGLREIAREQQGRFRGPESQQVAECARELPQLCGAGRSCYQIRGV